MVRFKGVVGKEKNTKTLGMYQELNELLNNEGFIHYVGAVKPFTPGIQECMINVQYMYFKPYEQQIDVFFKHTVRWAGNVWVIMTVPIEYRGAVEEIVKGCGLYSINGIPLMLINDEWQTFLHNSGRIFVLDVGADHPIRRGDPLVEQMLMEAEYITIDKIIRT